ncbi:hypothetical protein [Agromyces sp. NPDC055658]
MTNRTVTPDEWIVGQLALAARQMPANASDSEVVIETIDTLRTLREHVGDAALREGLDLDTPVGPDTAARFLRDASPALTRTLIKAVPQ